MTAALETAAAGYPVHLVESPGKLGGIWGEQYKRVPFRAAAAGVPNGNNEDLPMPEDPGVDQMAARCAADPRITVHLNAKLTKTSGAPGRFAADVTTESGSTVAGNDPQVRRENHTQPRKRGDGAMIRAMLGRPAGSEPRTVVAVS